MGIVFDVFVSLLTILQQNYQFNSYQISTNDGQCPLDYSLVKLKEKPGKMQEKS